jgi:hypothetical protein
VAGGLPGEASLRKTKYFFRYVVDLHRSITLKDRKGVIIALLGSFALPFYHGGGLAAAVGSSHPYLVTNITWRHALFRVLSTAV